jgi:divalent metal cation (Fe/Co/Zn/Cd) transporter
MSDADRLLRQGLLLEYVTLGWNIVGSAIVIATAVAAHSVALAGFGLDSLIEIGASTIVVWQLKGAAQNRERRALRVIAASFVALAIYVLGQSTRTLLLELHPDSSRVGIAWLALTFAAMVALATGKGRVGAKLNNSVLKAEARVTMVDALLAGSVLIGIVLNAALGWWWADPVSGLVIVFYGIKEGRHAWGEAQALEQTPAIDQEAPSS